MLAALKPNALQICRVKAATDVLPLVPVTAAMVLGWRGKNFAAASASARRAFATRTNAASRGAAPAPPAVPNPHDPRVRRGGRRLLGEDRNAARRDRWRDEARAVGLVAGNGDEDLATLGGAAVRRNPADVEIGMAWVEVRIRRQ